MKNSENKFLVIGAQKAGTSWLWQQLRMHPGVWMPPVKELHYFDYLYTEDTKNWGHFHVRTSVNKALKWHIEELSWDKVDYSYIEYLGRLAGSDIFTESWYLAAYNRDAAHNKSLGDITPEYCAISRDGVEYVKSLLGDDLKIIYIIRDPLERALSQLRMNVQRSGEQKPSLDKWREMADADVILQRGNYAAYIENWESVFDESSILYMPFGSIATSPAKFIEAVETHINVDCYDGYTGIKKKIHATKSYSIPQQIVDELKVKLDPQYHFLRNKFDNEFISQI